MAKQSSRGQKQRRSFPFEQGAQGLLPFLNGDLPEALKNRRILDRRTLLLLVKRLQALESMLADRNIPLFRRGEQDELVDSPAVLRKFRAVNWIIGHYMATPEIRPDYFTGGNSPSRGWHLVWNPAGQRPRTAFEFPIAFQILELARAGRISALRQCANCHRWLFARFAHQRFCKQSCKETFHRSDEADKERRRAEAKRRYWDHKALDTGSSKVN
jgi:hypothetical protein